MQMGFGSNRESITQALVCHISRERQDEVSTRLATFLEQDVSRLDGFLEASVNKGLAGDTVLVFFEWESQNHHASSLKQPAVQRALKELAALCTGMESYLYEKVSERSARPFDAPVPGLAAHENPSGLV